MEIKFDNGGKMQFTPDEPVEWVDGVMKGTVSYSCVKCGGQGSTTEINKHKDGILIDIIMTGCGECGGKGVITEAATITLPKVKK